MFTKTPQLDYHSALLFILQAGQIETISNLTPVLIFILLLLLTLSFMISGSEVAFFSLNYKDINLLKTKKTDSYKRIVNLLEDPKILLASMLIANNLINIAIIVISNLLLTDIIPESLIHLVWLEFVVKVVLVTSLLLLVCEVMPKVMATQNNVRFAKEVGLLLESINYIFKPFSKILVKYSDVIEKRINNKTSAAVTNEEMSHAIDITYSEESGKSILKGILEFGTITVKQIMKTRLDVSGIVNTATFLELKERIAELHYSRLPVYKDDLDEVIGIIHTKDLMPYIDVETDFDWHKLIRPPFFVHEQKLIEDLLQEFQSKRIHFAVVVADGYRAMQ